ncbi:MAG TPA: hypothetical protein VG326_03580 [Tepidisphaeraceae bacterium]|jgi:hypothetical protein|nr:hypothetical protein [Tepidisphaeraceae bacterium]
MRKSTTLFCPVLVLALTGAASACPSCRDAIAGADGAGTAGISGAFNSSIYLMLAAFLGVLGMVAGVIVKGIKNS